MARPKRRKANAAPVEEQEETTQEATEVVKALFADVMEGSSNSTVDPQQCIPLTKVREIIRSGVERIKNLFSGMSNTGWTPGDNFEAGIAAGSDMPIVIPLTGVYRRQALDHFKGLGMTDTEAKEKLGARPVWYGVVDGTYRLIALRELIQEFPARWCGFSWPVTVLRGGHDIQVLKQLARQQNRRHAARFYVETTFFDTLRGLRDEAVRLRIQNNNKQPTARQVACAFDGSSHKSENTIRQTAAMVMRLDDRVIEVIGEIVNAEHPDLAVPYTLDKNHGDRVNRATFARTLDCRVFRNFIHCSSLKSATKFMNAAGEDGILSQINTLYRIRETSRLHRFKPVSFKVVAEQFQKATSALKEVRKFERLIETTKWPSEMTTMRKNLLQTGKFDVEVSINSGNEHTILNNLLAMYRKVCPEVASFKEAKYRDTYVCVRNPRHPDDSGPGNSAETTKAPISEHDDDPQVVSPQQPVPRNPESYPGKKGMVDGNMINEEREDPNEKVFPRLPLPTLLIQNMGMSTTCPIQWPIIERRRTLILALPKRQIPNPFHLPLKPK